MVFKKLNIKHLCISRSKALFILQICLLHGSRAISKIWIRSRTQNWVVGPTETAKTVCDLNGALPGSISVNLIKHMFYEQTYDYHCESSRASLFFGPVLLGKLSRQFAGFVYVGPNGYLVSNEDYREYEFRMLRKWGCKIVSYQVGSEIRSIKRLERWGLERNIDTYATVINNANSLERLALIEKDVCERARVIDKHAHLIFNSDIDQMSYLKSPTVPSMYFAPENIFDFNTKKFDRIDNLKILHAPSDPTIKGTSDIRNAVDLLKDEGYRFDYCELESVPHDVVLNELKCAHIVVNELYSMMPGVFAVEAMANKCVLLTSANWEYETSLGPIEVNPWLITNRSNIYENIKWCLENISQLESQADAGQKWAWNKASHSANSKILSNILQKILEK